MSGIGSGQRISHLDLRFSSPRLFLVVVNWKSMSGILVGGIKMLENRHSLKINPLMTIRVSLLLQRVELSSQTRKEG